MDLQCSWVVFLAVFNVFDVLILSGALFYTLAASHVKPFFCFCWCSNFCTVSSSKTSSCNGIFLSFSCLHFYWVLWVIGSFPHFCELDCAAIWLTDSIIWVSKIVFVLFVSETKAPSRILSILFCDLCAIVMHWLFCCCSVSLTLVQSCT